MNTKGATHIRYKTLTWFVAAVMVMSLAYATPGAASYADVSDPVNIPDANMKKAFNGSADANVSLDKDNLADGDYTVRVTMKNASNPRQNSMSNDAIEHYVDLTVSGGAYYVTLDFKGLEISLGGSGFFGYLKELSYYDAGYTFGEWGAIVGTQVPAAVLTTQKNDDGSDVVDSYNSGQGWLYPDLIRFPLVNKANYEDDFVPLHVFVPIMDAITPGSGNQDVFMLIDWTSLTTGTVEENGGNDGGDESGGDEVVKTALTAKVTEASAISQGRKSAAAYAALQSAVAAARSVMNDPGATQAAVNAALAALNSAIAAFAGSADVTGGDQNQTPGGDHQQTPGGEVTLTSLSTLRIVAADRVWTGRKIDTGFTLTAGGKALSAGKDYTITSTGANRNIGPGTVKISGTGGYSDTATVTFKIVPKAVKLKSVKAGTKALTAKWGKAPKAEKITKYQVRWKVKGTKSWKAKVVSAKKTVLKIGKLKKGKRYDVQVRAYKTVRGVKYYSAWSRAKSGGKVK